MTSQKLSASVEEATTNCSERNPLYLFKKKKKIPGRHNMHELIWDKTHAIFKRIIKAGVVSLGMGCRHHFV